VGFYCCVAQGAKLSVCLSAADEEAFLTALISEGVDAALVPFAAIDCASAQATNKQDVEKIGAEIKRTVGFGRLDALVLEKLREWVTDTAAAKLAAAQDHSTGRFSLALRHVEILDEQGRKEEAQQVCIEAVRLCAGLEAVIDGCGEPTGDFEQLCNSTGFFGAQRDMTLRFKLRLLVACGENGMLDLESDYAPTWLAVMRDIVASCELHQDDDPSELLDAKQNLAACLIGTGPENCKEAKELFSSVIPQLQSSAKLKAQANYAYLLQTIFDDDAGALVLYETVVEGLTVKNGKNHPETLSARNNLAETWKVLGNLGKAKEELLQVLKGRLINLGDTNALTVQSMWNLAVVNTMIGELEDAVLLVNRCIECAEASEELDEDDIEEYSDVLAQWQQILARVNDENDPFQLNAESPWERMVADEREPECYYRHSGTE